jgi:hypothetical protein
LSQTWARCRESLSKSLWLTDRHPLLYQIPFLVRALD